MTPPPPIVVRIPVALPFHGAALLDFLAARAVPGVEVTGPGWYARTLSLPGGPATIRLDIPTGGAGAETVGTGRSTARQDSASSARSPADGTAAHSHAIVTATLYLADPADEADAITRCRHLIGADAPADLIHATLVADPVLAAAVRAAPGLRVPGAVDGPEILIRALVGQQVSVAAARTALAELTVAADERATSPIPGLTHLFPSPRAIAGLEAIAGPRRRAAAIAAAAADMASGAVLISPDRGLDELTAELVTRPGIGPWTAGYVAMRALAAPDVLLTGDLALRQGAAELGISDLVAHGERWRPFRSFAGMYLWRARSATNPPSPATRRSRG